MKRKPTSTKRPVVARTLTNLTGINGGVLGPIDPSLLAGMPTASFSTAAGSAQAQQALGDAQGKLRETMQQIQKSIEASNKAIMNALRGL